MESKALLRRFDKTIRRYERELAEFACSDDKATLLARKLADKCWDNVVGVLANYATLTDHNGKEHDTDVAIDRLKDSIAEAFKAYTGQVNVNEVQRERKHEHEFAEKLLRAMKETNDQ